MRKDITITAESRDRAERMKPAACASRFDSGRGVRRAARIR